MFKCKICNRSLISLKILYGRPSYVQNLPTRSTTSEDSRVDLLVCQCTGCGLVQLENSPVSYYRESARSSGVSKSLKDRQSKVLGRFINNFSLEGSNIIEVGVGGGEYLQILNDLGAKATGLTVYPSDVKINKDFDAFVCINFLEHSPDPNDFLLGMGKLIKEEGVGLISVPDFESELHNNGLLTFMIDHLLYFTKETLSTALEVNGFEVDRIFNNYELNVITTYVRKKKRLDLGRANLSLQLIVNSINNFKKDRNKLAIWGASHIALSILPYISGISYIVDSSTSKQGKYATGSKVKIYSPEHLSADPIDGVIILSPEYYKEIFETLSCKYNIGDVIALVDGDMKWLK